MRFLLAAIAVLILLLWSTAARSDNPTVQVGQADSHNHSATEERGDAQDSETPAHARSVPNHALAWLVMYCVFVVLASFIGCWLPQWFVLSHNRMQTAISLIGGLMLGIGVFHMLPHALVELGPSGPDLAAHGMMVGLVIMFLLLRAFHFHHHGTLDSLHPHQDSACGHGHSHSADHHHEHEHAHGPAVGVTAARMSWLGVFVGMAFHSIGDGLALGASIEADALHGSAAWPGPGFGTFLAVAFHKPVDSISITTLMAAGGWSGRARMLVNAGFSLICPAGAILFVLGVREFSDRQAMIVGMALAVSAGVFICIALGDLLPEMEFHSHNRLRLTVALLTGVALAWAIRFLEPPHAHSHGDGHRHTRSSILEPQIRAISGTQINPPDTTETV